MIDQTHADEVSAANILQLSARLVDEHGDNDQQVSQVTDQLQWLDFDYSRYNKLRRLVSTNNQLANLYNH